MRQDSYHEWQHREIECRLYKYPKPDGHRWVGYIKLGDEWHEAVDSDSINEEDAIERTESHVSLMLARAKAEERDYQRPQPSPIDDLPDVRPDPLPDTDPWPNPSNPFDPDVIWNVENDDGTCEACRRLREGTTWQGEPPKCARHRDNTVPSPMMGTTSDREVIGAVWL